MSKTKFLLQIYRQYFNYPNILTKIICGPNENRTRVSSVTSWKDNHYPIRPMFSTPYRIRTCGPQLRRLLLYPTELREHIFLILCKYTNFVLNFQINLQIFYIFVSKDGIEPPIITKLLLEDIRLPTHFRRICNSFSSPGFKPYYLPPT